MDDANPMPYPTRQDLETVLQNGIKAGNLFSYILASIDRRIDETAQVVAYVSLNSKRAEWTLVINPILFTEILETYPNVNRERLLSAILKHEFLHIARDHFERSFALKDRYSMAELNIAADLAVNCTLDLNEQYLLSEIGALIPSLPPFNMPDGLSMEQYLALLPRNLPVEYSLNFKMADCEATMQEIQESFDRARQKERIPYERQEDLEAAATQNLKARVRKLMKNLEEKQMNHGVNPGFHSGDWDWVMEWAFPKVRISWKRLLKNSLMKMERSRERVRSYRRSHPRAEGGILLKGKIPAKKEQILVMLDTSGSMQEEDYTQFMGVIQSLLSERRSFSIVQWDYECQSEPIPIETYMRSEKPWFQGGGGTDMRRGVLDMSKKYPQYTRIIVVTDGGTPYFTKKDPSPVPVIWVLTSYARFTNAVGDVIRLYPD